jgi:hypothetical protein
VAGKNFRIQASSQWWPVHSRGLFEVSHTRMAKAEEAFLEKDMLRMNLAISISLAFML